jgi:hypothetical protein
MNQNGYCPESIFYGRERIIPEILPVVAFTPEDYYIDKSCVPSQQYSRISFYGTHLSPLSFLDKGKRSFPLIHRTQFTSISALP